MSIHIAQHTKLPLVKRERTVPFSTKYKFYKGFSLHSISNRNKKGEKVIILKSFGRGLAGM